MRWGGGGQSAPVTQSWNSLQDAPRLMPAVLSPLLSALLSPTASSSPSLSCLFDKLSSSKIQHRIDIRRCMHFMYAFVQMQMQFAFRRCMNFMYAFAVCITEMYAFHVCICTNANAHTIHTCEHACMHVCMYVCMNSYTLNI